MSTRHIFAKPGQHVYVHRHGNEKKGDDTLAMFFGFLLLAGGVIWFVATFWKLLVTIALVALAIWLIWVFRVQLWQLICWICRSTVNGVQHLHQHIVQKWANAKVQRTLIDVTPLAEETRPGKIIQHRRR